MSFKGIVSGMPAAGLVVGTVRAKNIAYPVVVRCCYVTSVSMYLIDLQLKSKKTGFKIGVETAFACI